MPATRFEATIAAPGPGVQGSRLYLWHAPDSAPARALVVFVHPFAEEMNKSRRMAALQSRCLASAGLAVLQADLLGCGDSSGEFSSATWTDWVDDVVAACARARATHASRWPEEPPPPLWLWGLRAGCLLAAEAAARLDCACDLLFWQPAMQGKTVLQQFLRLKTAGALMGKSGHSSAETPRQTLAAGHRLDVAGYGLGPELAAGLESARLLPPPRGGRLVWIEIAVNADGTPSPAAAAAMPAWTNAGWLVRQRSVAGPQFWQTTEVEEAPELIAATVQALSLDAWLPPRTDRVAPSTPARVGAL